MGLALFGTLWKTWFLEVCAGAGVLTQAVRLGGMSTGNPVDKRDDSEWDLSVAAGVRRAKALIFDLRPLLTHFPPDCKIFSIAFRLHCDATLTAGYNECMNLAINSKTCSILCSFRVVCLH